LAPGIFALGPKHQEGEEEEEEEEKEEGTRNRLMGSTLRARSSLPPKRNQEGRDPHRWGERGGGGGGGGGGGQVEEGERKLKEDQAYLIL